MRIRRRAFFGTAAAITGAVGTTACTTLDRDVQRLGDALRGRLRELNVPRETAERFAADFIRHRGTPDKLEEAIARRFLMSTDFFQHGAKPAHELSYVAYYDPYVTLCYNPLRAPEPASDEEPEA